MRLLTTLQALRKSRPVSEADQVVFTNRELIPLLADIRDFIAQLEEGENDCDIILMKRVDGVLQPEWGAPRARVLHLNASELVGGLLDYTLASRIHLYLDQDTALTVNLPELAALDETEGITGSSAHCTLRITNAGGFNVTSWPSNVKHKSGTSPNFATMTANQRWYCSLYADGTDDVIDCINSGPFG